MEIENNKAVFSQKLGTIVNMHTGFVCLRSAFLSNLDNIVASNFKLEGVPLLVKRLESTEGELAWGKINSEHREGVNPYAFLKGWNAHSEKYKFTESDVIEAFEQGNHMMFMKMNGKIVKYENSSDYMKSINKPQIPERLELDINYLVDGVIVGKESYNQWNSHLKSIELKSDNGKIYY